MERERTELPVEPSACRRARSIVESLRGALPEGTFGDVVLVADELVTQALVAGPSPKGQITFEVSISADEIAVAASDRDEGYDARHAFNIPAGSRGLGLVIVSEVADRWGIEHHDGRTRAWASFAVPPRGDDELVPEERIAV